MSDDGRESGGDTLVGPVVQLQQQIYVHQLSTQGMILLDISFCYDDVSVNHF